MRISRKTKREILSILMFFLCIPFAYGLVLGRGGYLQLRSCRAELRQLQMENLRLRQLHQDLLARIRKIKQDPEEVERIARDRYNYARPGDVIINLPEATH